jgi:hypothetical protein
VEYQSYPSGRWKPALFEMAVIEQMKQQQYYHYMNRAKTTDCQAELRRLLATGPPIYLSDPIGLPLDGNDTHVIQLWYAHDDQVRSAKLDGALQGLERQQAWDELQKFLIVEGKEEGDDDNENDLGNNAVTR